MKKAFTLLAIIALLGCSKSQQAANNKKATSGTITYSIQIDSEENINPDDFGKEAKAVFNSTKLHFQKMNGDDEAFQIVDLATGRETNYLNFKGKKYALTTSDEMLPKIGALEFQKDKKVIAGYSCQKATATMGDGMLEAWFTQDLGVNFCPYIPAKGFALEYTLNMPYGKVTYVATKVAVQSVDEQLFQPSSEYREVTIDELQAELMGQPQGTAFEKGTTLANFELKDMDGKMVNLEQLKGKVVLINFWFINCPPCRHEMPDLNKLKAEYAGKNVEFIAITFDSKNNVSDFLKKKKFDFQIIPDARNLIETYGVTGFPTTVVLDKNGKVVDSKMGGSMNIQEELKAFIEKAK